MQDSKQIDELFRLMDAVCENGDAALPALEQYLQTQTDAPEIDTEASLKKFKADHKEFFVKPHRGRRLCYRVFVVAAAVFAAGTVFALATGHNPFDYAAMWGAETFGFSMMIFLRRKTERSSIILMVHGMIALICRIMTMKRILRCPKIILLQ